MFVDICLRFAYIIFAYSGGLLLKISKLTKTHPNLSCAMTEYVIILLCLAVPISYRLDHISNCIITFSICLNM
uniref:Uncharacterized protein n=1 Tax=Arundo donax TaxID=35708 RepID=A0A0A9N2A0_ARUDO